MTSRINATHLVAVIGYVYYNDTFLLLKRSNSPKIWAPPGGKLLPNESPEKGLKREVYEETGLVIDVLKPANIWFGEITENVKMLSIDFLVRIKSGNVKISNEHEAYAWTSIADLISGNKISLGNSKVSFKISDFINAETQYKSLYNNLPNDVNFSL